MGKMGAGPFKSLAEQHRWWKEEGGWQLRRLLFWRWDPIGVSDSFPSAYDEYDSYAGGVAAVLHDGGGAAQVEAHLRRLETEHMGLQDTAEAAAKRTAVARLICDWYSQSVSSWRGRARGAD